MRCGLLLSVVMVALLGAPAAAASAPATAIFYYPWYGTPTWDATWQHWAQNGAVPPRHVGSQFYPARGAYSSSDTAVLAAQMKEIAAAGIGEVVVSWWGRGSAEDGRLPAVAAAARADGLAVAAHLEPYPGRTAVTVASDLAYLRARGITDVYVYDSSALSDADWATLNAGLAGMRLFANTPFAGKAAAGRFAGLYTYDVLVYSGGSFPRLCAQARKVHLICAPSVGPGFDARRATGEPRVRPRENGATYDAMWRQALRARAPVVTITSYNEWHEGTQIEPARPAPGYESYDGAWGLHGMAAETAYVNRTAYWIARLSTAQSRAAAGTRR